MTDMMTLAMTPDEAFAFWDRLPDGEPMKARLAEMIAAENRIGHMPRPVRIEFWTKGNSRVKPRASVSASLFVQGEAAWREHYINPGQVWRRVEPPA